MSGSTRRPHADHRRWIVAIVVAATALVSCGGDEATPSTTTPPPTTVPEVPEVSNATCTDPAGDLYLVEGTKEIPVGAAPAGIDLRRATTTVTRDELVVSFEVVGPIDALSSPSFTMLADIPPQSNSFDLKVTGGDDGWAVNRTTFDADGTPHVTPLEATTDLTPTMVTVTVERLDLPRIGRYLSLNYGAEAIDKDTKMITDRCFLAALEE